MKHALPLLCLLLAGCASSGSGVRWYAPATWFSGSEGRAVEKAEKRQESAENAAGKALQRSVHETDLALRSAPASRAVEVATESSAQAVTLADQLYGPLTAAEASALRAQIAGLLSENAQIRADAEKARQKGRDEALEASQRLAEAQSETADVKEKLEAAFRRENALANDLRAQRWLAWIAGVIALLCAAGWVYVKFALGGLPGAIAKGLSALRAKGAIPPAHEDNVFDSYLNRHEQALIAKHTR